MSQETSDITTKQGGALATLDFVKDSGMGISDENIKNITKPFFQADKSISTKGFGLGLTICKKIIESHKGRLSIQSERGKGSVFTLHLPPIKG